MTLSVSAVCWSQDYEETNSTVLHLLRGGQSHDFQEAQISIEELEASIHVGEDKIKIVKED